MKGPLPEKYVTKVAWEKMREPFRQVWSRETKRVDVSELEAKIYRVGNIVRIDIRDDPS